MKKTFFLFLITFSLGAQIQKKTKPANLLSAERLQSTPANSLYAFSTFTSSYQPITGTSLSSGTKWDDPFYSIILGFEFKLYSDHGTTINLLGGSGVTFNNNPNSTIMTIMSPIFEDICDRAFDPSIDMEGDPGGISDISYTVTGQAGSHICKIQVDNAGFFGEVDAGGASVSFVNFQVWLYEGTNDIEFRFGAVNIQNPSINLDNPSGFICGLAETVNLNTANNQSSNVLSGPHANPSMVALNASGNQVVTGPIQSGRVYKFARFNPNPVGISSIGSSDQFSLFPNPVSKTLYCKGDPERMKDGYIYFYSMDGRLVSTKKLEPEMDLSEINKGVYFIKIQSNNKEYPYSGKLIVKDY